MNNFALTFGAGETSTQIHNKRRRVKLIFRVFLLLLKAIICSTFYDLIVNKRNEKKVVKQRREASSIFLNIVRDFIVSHKLPRIKYVRVRGKIADVLRNVFSSIAAFALRQHGKFLFIILLPPLSNFSFFCFLLPPVAFVFLFMSFHYTILPLISIPGNSGKIRLCLFSLLANIFWLMKNNLNE